jgi:hypothetical protein
MFLARKSRHLTAPAILLAGLAIGLTTGARTSFADTWSIEANLVVPDQSLKAHQTGPGLSLQWERPLAPHWSTTVSTGYLALLTKRTPSYQMVPIQGGIRWALRDQGHSPFLAADLGLFPVVESFSFRFADTVVSDDDATVYWGPGVSLGYQVSFLVGSVGYQLLLPSSSDAGFLRARCGYRFQR